MTGVAFNTNAAGLGECGAGRRSLSGRGGAPSSPFRPPSRRAVPGRVRGRGGLPRLRAGRGVSAPSLSDNFLSKPQGGRRGLSRGERGGGGGSKRGQRRGRRGRGCSVPPLPPRPPHSAGPTAEGGPELCRPPSPRAPAASSSSPGRGDTRQEFTDSSLYGAAFNYLR